MKWFASIFLLIGLIATGVFLDYNNPELRIQASDYFLSEDLHTLECKYTAAQIMDSHSKFLLKTDEHRYLNPEVKFHPYLLMDVKYTGSNDQTGEGIILWDMIDGEMVINERNWEKTHGFHDCITAGIDRSEFKIINMLAQKGGSIDRDGLTKNLHVETDIIDVWVENCTRKKLIVRAGNGYRLHIEKPKIFVQPETKIEDRLVTKTIKNAEKLTRKFSEAQIRKIAYAAFGQDFVIRSYKKVFLPICTITVENPDGSLHTSYWNTLNGQQMAHYAFFE